MKFTRWIIDEGKSIQSVTLYFAACFGLIMLLKRLMLAQYGIDFHGLSTAVLGALVTAKVVIVVEKAPLNRWLGRPAAIVDLVVRSAVYTMATLLVLLLEKALESRSEYVGVEAGQLLFVGAVLAALWLGQRVVASIPQWLRHVPAYAIGSLAAFWLIARVAAFG